MITVSIEKTFYLGKNTTEDISAVTTNCETVVQIVCMHDSLSLTDFVDTRKRFKRRCHK